MAERIEAGATAFLTGATGFIGGRLAAALHGRGYRLRCLVRAPERAASLASLGAELVVGDIADEAALAKGLRGAAVAYHLAGAYDLGVVNAAAMEHANIEGTRAFLAALRANPVPKAVYVSTVMALGPSRGPVDEDADYRGPFSSIYSRTKTEAHRLARAAQRDGTPLVIACPALVYGPGDEGPIGRVLKDTLRHRLPALSTRSAWFSFVHVDDVVAGLVAAGERGRPGATYVLSGEDAPVQRLVEDAARLANTWLTPLRVPPFLVRATGSLMDGFTRLTGVPMPVTRELASLAASDDWWLHSHERATNELGYSPRPLAEGLPDTIRWVKEQVAK